MGRDYPNSIDRARRPKTGRPHRIVQLGYAPKYTTRVSALVAREKDTFPGKIGVDAYYSAFRRERNPKQIGQKNSMCSFPVRLLARLFLFSPLFSFSRKGKEGVRAPHWRNRNTGLCPAHQRKPDRALKALL